MLCSHRLYMFVTGFSAAQIDLPLANVEQVTEQLNNVFGFSPEESIQVHYT